MTRMMHARLTKSMVMFLTFTFVSFDLAWAHPSIPADDSSLAAQSIFQQQMMTEGAEAFRRSVMADRSFALAVAAIGKFVFEDGYPIDRLQSTLMQEPLGREALTGFNLSSAGMDGQTVVMRYSQANRDYVIQIARKGSPEAAQMVGSDCLEGGKYAVRVCPLVKTTGPIASSPGSAEADPVGEDVYRSIVRVIADRRDMSLSQLFDIVDAEVPERMGRLKGALGQLRMTSGKAGCSADEIVMDVRSLQVRWGLSDTETRILRLAVLGPGQGGAGNAANGTGRQFNLWAAVERIGAIRKNMGYLWDLKMASIHDEAKAMMEGKAVVTPESFRALTERYAKYLEGGDWQKANSARYGLAPDERVAYFCMEYGLSPKFNTYGGGLGILAGDHLRGASDRYAHGTFTGVGLAWSKGYYRQVIRENWMGIGSQGQDYPDVPIRDMGEPVKTKGPDGKETDLVIKIEALAGKYIYFKAWRVMCGRSELYLLDTDIEENERPDALEFARALTRNLYAADEREWRFKQEFLLGVGGMRLLSELKLKPAALHINEGHAAFAAVELLRLETERRQEERGVSANHAYDLRRNHPGNARKLGLTLEQCVEAVRAKVGFTSHTPIPAGNEEFEEALFRRYFEHYCNVSGIDIEFLARHTIHQSKVPGRGRMANLSKLAIALCAEVPAEEVKKDIRSRKIVTRNGVSWKGGLISQDLYGDRSFGAITNAVHRKFWQSPVMQRLLESKWADLQAMGRVPSVGIEELDEAGRKTYLRALVDSITEDELITARDRMKEDAVEHLAKLRGIRLNKNAFTIVISRRFASYKRLGMILGIDDSKSVMAEDFKGQMLDRLIETAHKRGMQLQIVFAGKAHPQDQSAKDLITKVHKAAKMDKWKDVIIFVPDYDIDVARDLIQIATVWENNPVPPQEASGTSGEKAASNGVMSVSTPDGWCLEADRQSTVFMFGREGHYADLHNATVDTLRAINERDIRELEELYTGEWRDRGTGHEKGIMDMYSNYPERWTQRMRGTIYDFLVNFNMPRFIEDYESLMYLPLVNGGRAAARQAAAAFDAPAVSDAGAAAVDPRIKELSGIVEGTVNNERARLVNDGNALRQMAAPDLPLDVEDGIGDAASVGMTAMEIRQRLEDVMVVAGQAAVAPDRAGLRRQIDAVKGRLEKLEADSIVSAVFVMARRAKSDKKKLIIGFETGWIPGYDTGKGPIHSALNPVVSAIDRLGSILEGMGLDNVKVIHEDKDRLADAVLKEAGDAPGALSNTVVIGSLGTVSSASFDRLRSAPGDERAFLVGIDTRHIEEYARLHAGEPYAIDVELLKVLSIALEVAAGKDPPRTPFISYDAENKARRLLILLPEARPVDCRLFERQQAAAAETLRAA